MKTIEPINIWQNGVNKQAVVFDAYACDVRLNINATFQYSLYSLDDEGYIDECLKQDSVFMNSQEYQLWKDDVVAWDFLANKLNLVITGDYVRPVEDVIS